MLPALSAYYSGRGPLGALTPVVAVLLNIAGIVLGVFIAKLLKGFLDPSCYDLDKIPAPPVVDPILGHARYLLRTDYHQVLLKWVNEYGSIFKFRILTDWTVVVTDPAAVAAVLQNIPGRTHNYKLVDEVLGGPGMVSMFGTLDEVHWRNTRKTTAPAFSMANVRRYYRGFLSSAGELLGSLEREQAALGGVELEPLLQRLTLRATLEGLFEVPDATCVPNFDRLASNVLLLLAEANSQITDPLRRWWYRTPLAPRLSKHFARCRQALRETVAFHRNTATRLLARPDPSPDNTLLWACLHRLRHPHTGRTMSPAQLAPEVGMYTTAGFDTTASTVGWCLYAASLHPAHQEALASELRAAGVFGSGAVVEAGQVASEAEAGDEGTRTTSEIEAAMETDLDELLQAATPGGGGGGGGGGAGISGGRGAPAGAGGGGGDGGGLRLVGSRCPSPEDLARLPLLNAFVNEVMRLYPAAAVSAERRSPDMPIRVMGYTLPASVTVWPIMYGIHMSDSNWERPEEFRPQRWIEDPRCAFARTAAPDAAAPAAAAPAATGARSAAAEGTTAPATATEQQQQPPGQPGAAAASAPDGSSAARRFMPFGDGPKNCVGQNFGITVVRAVVALLLSRYRVTLHPDMLAPGSSKGGLPDTGALTQVAVTTKLKRLRLVLQQRD